MRVPKPQELPSGKFRVQFMLDGKRISVIDDDPDRAQAKAVAIRARLIQERKPTTLTVGRAIDKYIESKDAVLSPATVAGYKRVRNNLMQDLIPVQLSALTQEKVQRSINRMVKDGKSPKTVRNAHGLLSAALAEYYPGFALRTTLPQKERFEPAIPSADDISAIFDAVRGTAIELPVMLAIWLGLRMSEILGLKREDVGDGVIHIRRAKVDEGEKTTKTFSSQRTLALPDYIRDLIAATPDGPNGHLVTFSRRALYGRFQTACKRAGVQHYRFHDLRHINASVMLILNVPDKYAMQRMGHATNNMLKTVYEHTMQAEEIRIAGMLDSYFLGLMHTELHTETAGDMENQV